jgi:hypothetical protein
MDNGLELYLFIENPLELDIALTLHHSSRELKEIFSMSRRSHLVSTSCLLAGLSPLRMLVLNLETTLTM